MKIALRKLLTNQNIMNGLILSAQIKSDQLDIMELKKAEDSLVDIEFKGISISDFFDFIEIDLSAIEDIKAYIISMI